jgi:predicted transcriptional regulator
MQQKERENMKKNYTTAEPTKTQKVLTALKAGEQLTAAQITARFGVKNPRAMASSLRFQGYAVYANEHKNSKGHSITKYRLGNPTREVIAAGYRALANNNA